MKFLQQRANVWMPRLYLVHRLVYYAGQLKWQLYFGRLLDEADYVRLVKVYR